MKGREEPSFEEAFAQLEELVGKLEEGGLPLEESIALFERAMGLVAHCQRKLDEAELRVTQLSLPCHGEVPEEESSE